MEAAKRELAEETGYRAAKWTELAQIIPSPGVLSERIWLYAAEDLTSGPTNLEPCENLEARVVSLTEAYRLLHDGEIVDAKTVIALYKLRERTGPAK